MDDFHELRMELSTTGAGQMHLAVFATDPTGQWMLVDDWVADNGDQAEHAIAEGASLVDGWLRHGVLTHAS